MVQETSRKRPHNRKIVLPQPKLTSRTSIEDVLLRRRSVRSFTKRPIAVPELSQLLWAAQGITGSGGLRTAPSAGALYPLEVHVLSANVTGLDPGMYRYMVKGHALVMSGVEDKRIALAHAALGQPSIADAAVVFVLSAVYERTTGKYGQRGMRYVHMEAGHAAQNVYLQATSLRLGTVVIGAFQDERVQSVLGLVGPEQPLYLMPIGKI